MSAELPRARASAAFVLALVLVTALGAALRLAEVGRDPPFEVEGTNAPSLDAFWYLEAAQAAADGSACEPHASYDRPVWVLVARGWFALFGTGIASSQALAAVLAAAGVPLLAWGLRPAGRDAALLAALVVAVSFPLVALARTGLIYAPLAAVLTAAWALHARGGAPGRASAIVLVLLLALLWKGVALTLLPGLLLAEVELSARNPRAVLLAAGALALLAATAAALDPTGDVARLGNYLASELRQPGPGSVVAAGRRVLLVPWESGLAGLAPGLVGLAGLGAVLLARRDARLSPGGRASLLAAAGWAGTVLLPLALLDYRPVRYFVLAGPPLAALAGHAAARLLEARARTGVRETPVALGSRALGTLGLVANGALALARAVGWRGAVPRPVAITLGAVGVVAAVAARRPPAPRLGRGLAALVLASALALDVARTAALSPADSLARASEAAQAALGRNAVLVGPYAPLLAAGARGLERRRATDLVGGPRAAEGLAVAERRGYTHVALDAEQDASGQLGAGFARAGQAPALLAVLLVGGEPVLLYRLRVARDAGYVASPFEEACARGDGGDAAGELDLLARARLPAALLQGRARALRLVGKHEDARRTSALVGN